MKYLVADFEEFNNPLYERYEDGSRPCFSDWLIFSDYESANAYVRNRLIEIDNPAVSFSIVPLDVDNAEQVELIVWILNKNENGGGESCNKNENGHRESRRRKRK